MFISNFSFKINHFRFWLQDSQKIVAPLDFFFLKITNDYILVLLCVSSAYFNVSYFTE